MLYFFYSFFTTLQCSFCILCVIIQTDFLLFGITVLFFANHTYELVKFDFFSIFKTELRSTKSSKSCNKLIYKLFKSFYDFLQIYV